MASMSGCICLHDDFGPVRRSSGGVWTLLTDANVSPARLIGSIGRECLDHIVVFGEDHLRRITEYGKR